MTAQQPQRCGRAKTMPGLARQPIQWLLLDTAPRLLPGLDPRLSKTADH